MTREKVTKVKEVGMKGRKTLLRIKTGKRTKKRKKGILCGPKSFGCGDGRRQWVETGGAVSGSNA